MEARLRQDRQLGRADAREIARYHLEKAGLPRYTKKNDKDPSWEERQGICQPVSLSERCETYPNSGPCPLTTLPRNYPEQDCALSQEAPVTIAAPLCLKLVLLCDFHVFLVSKTQVGPKAPFQGQECFPVLSHSWDSTKDQVRHNFGNGRKKQNRMYHWMAVALKITLRKDCLPGSGYVKIEDR